MLRYYSRQGVRVDRQQSQQTVRLTGYCTLKTANLNLKVVIATGLTSYLSEQRS